jgi:hypothetical protein
MMPQVPTWILIACGTASLVWLLIYRRFWQPAETETPVSPDEEPEAQITGEPLPKFSWQALRIHAPTWLRKNGRYLAYLLLAIGLVLVIWQLSPRAFSQRTTQPGQPGRPLFAFSFVRSFQLNLAQNWAWIVAIVIGLASVSLLITAHLRRRPQPAQIVLLLTSLGLAALAQLAQLEYYIDSLLVLYAMAALFLSIWILGYHTHIEADLLTERWPIRFEIILLLIPIAITIWARVSALPDIPYGVEGDESKWTVEVVAAMIDGDFPHSTAYHLSSVPGSFYMQAPFHRILGPSLLSARIAVVFYSILGSLAFYWLARELTSPPVAWLATLLLATSIFDVSASRLANVESHVKLWPVLSLALLAHASRTGKKSAYLFAGIAASVGMLTYDTVAPLIPLAGMLAIYELVRTKVPFAESIRRLSVFTIPVLAAMPVTVAYLAGRMQYYDLAEKGWGSSAFESFTSHLGDLLHSIFRSTWSDFLYSRDGPLFNSLLIPWLLAGFLLLLLCWRRGRLLWVLLFALFFFFPVPILTNSPMGRVLYPGLPAAYLIMAVAMIASLRAIERVIGSALRPALFSLATLGVGFVCVLNMYIYFNEVHDPEDRRIRRAVYDIVREVSAPDVITLLPYVPKGDDPIQQEGEQMIWFALRTKSDSADNLPPSLTLPLDDLLPTLSSQPAEIERAELIWDYRSSFARAERDDLLSTFLSCYPGAILHQGPYFNRYTIPGESLRSPQCRSGTLSLEPAFSEVAPNWPLLLNWNLSGASTADLNLECSTVREDLLYVHAEDMLGVGWESIDQFVTGFDGRGFLTDHQGSQTASLKMEFPEARPVYVWVRSLRRVLDDFPGFLGVDSESDVFSQAGSVPLNEWTWERTGPFLPAAEYAELRIDRPYPQTQAGYMALFIDTLLVTASDSFDPTSDPIWEPAIEMGIPMQERATEGDFLLTTGVGRYLCWVSAFDGTSLVDHRGNIGLRSNPVEVIILPTP